MSEFLENLTERSMHAVQLNGEGPMLALIEVARSDPRPYFLLNEKLRVFFATDAALSIVGFNLLEIRRDSRIPQKKALDEHILDCIKNNKPTTTYKANWPTRTGGIVELDLDIDLFYDSIGQFSGARALSHNVSGTVERPIEYTTSRNINRLLTTELDGSLNLMRKAAYSDQRAFVIVDNTTAAIVAGTAASESITTYSLAEMRLDRDLSSLVTRMVKEYEDVAKKYEQPKKRAFNLNSVEHETLDGHILYMNLVCELLELKSFKGTLVTIKKVEREPLFKENDYNVMRTSYEHKFIRTREERIIPFPYSVDRRFSMINQLDDKCHPCIDLSRTTDIIDPYLRYLAARGNTIRDVTLINPQYEITKEFNKYGFPLEDIRFKGAA